jgi:transcriptional regulator with XRE-family HTH domain
MKPADRIKLAERLKELREERGLSRQQLGDALNLSPTAIAGYEQGYRVPKLGNMQDLASFFTVSLEYLIGKTDDKESISINSVEISDSIVGDFFAKLTSALQNSNMTPKQKQDTLELLLGVLEAMIKKNN